MRKRILVAALAAVSLGVAQAQGTAELEGEAAAKIDQLFSTLAGELQAAMKAGGPANAIAVCNERAPAIAADLSADGWQVGRTSLKLRNPDNAPDAWELQVLEAFESRRAAGEDPTRLVHAEVVEDGSGVFRFMKAIPTGELCLTCHGSDIRPEVEATLNELYPQDRARGYAAGELRGAFTLSKPL
jgi:hypothetical protein